MKKTEVKKDAPNYKECLPNPNAMIGAMTAAGIGGAIAGAKLTAPAGPVAMGLGAAAGAVSSSAIVGVGFATEHVLDAKQCIKKVDEKKAEEAKEKAKEPANRPCITTQFQITKKPQPPAVQHQHQFSSQPMPRFGGGWWK